MTEFIGHFHPLLVHLPIGMLLMALVLQWLSRKEKFAALKPSIAFVLLCGTFAALLSCISGYVLSISDDYNKSTVSWHMWMGIATTLVSLLLFAKEKNAGIIIDKRILSVCLLILITVTGHLGGSLTHGSDYLSKPFADIFSKDSFSSAAIQPISNVQEAAVYHDVISPILQSKCYHCHNAEKQKGGLRMDDSLLLMKGGKDGKIIMPGNAQKSEMIKRILLPVDNDDHMPPKEKAQPTEQQIALLQWWISNNAPLSQKVKELNQPERIKPMLLALQNAAETIKESTDIPGTPVEKADEKIIELLRQKGISILPVAQNTNYLQANFATTATIDKESLQLLVELKKQLIFLKIRETDLNDGGLEYVSQLFNLIKLDLSGTQISDKGLPMLQTLTKLQYINLTHTKITAKSLATLKNLSQLNSIFLFETGVNKTEENQIKNYFPGVQIDFGGYIVPVLASDTTEVRYKKTY